MSRALDFGHLVELCRRTHEETRRSAARAADTYLVTRNWLFGWYIVEYEDGGADRSTLYGRKLIARLSDELKAGGLKGCSPTNLRKSREFYRAYREIRQTASVESQAEGFAMDSTDSVCRITADRSGHRAGGPDLPNRSDTVGPIRVPAGRAVVSTERGHQPAGRPIHSRMVPLRHPPDHRQRRRTPLALARSNGARKIAAYGHAGNQRDAQRRGLTLEILQTSLGET